MDNLVANSFLHFRPSILWHLQIHSFRVFHHTSNPVCVFLLWKLLGPLRNSQWQSSLIGESFSATNFLNTLGLYTCVKYTRIRVFSYGFSLTSFLWRVFSNRFSLTSILTYFMQRVSSSILRSFDLRRPLSSRHSHLKHWQLLQHCHCNEIICSPSFVLTCLVTHSSDWSYSSFLWDETFFC